VGSGNLQMICSCVEGGGGVSGEDVFQQNIAEYLRMISRYPLLQPDEEVALAKRIKAGDEEAFKRLYLANLRLVVGIARRYVSRGIDLLDLIQEGNIGLLRAARQYDWQRGAKFSTHATWWILLFIRRAIADKGRMIRLPLYLQTMMNRIHRAKEMYIVEHNGSEPTIAKLAQLTGYSISRVTEALQAQQIYTISLDTFQKRNEDEDESAEEPPVKACWEGSASTIEQGRREEWLEYLLREAALSERERVMVDLRFGLKDGRSRTLLECGKEISMTGERARQIEKAALGKLRAAAHRLISRGVIKAPYA
jgi:RNA polymerase primary sigma factor